MEMYKREAENVYRAVRMAYEYETGEMHISYIPKDSFEAVFTLKGTSKKETAGAQNYQNLYLVTVPSGTRLECGDIIIRDANNGKAAIVTEKLGSTPESAGISMEQVYAVDYVIEPGETEDDSIND